MILYISVFPLVVGGPIERLPFPAGKKSNVFLDLSVPVAGRITSWGFYAQNTGQVFAAIWRPLGNRNYKIIGKNKLTANVLGKQVKKPKQCVKYLFAKKYRNKPF